MKRTGQCGRKSSARAGALEPSGAASAQATDESAAQRSEQRVAALVRNGAANGAPFEVTAAGLELVARWARTGASNNRIAASLGCSRNTFRDLRARQPEVDDALAAGRAALDQEVVDELLKMGRAGNVTALIWLSKNRLGWRDNPTEGSGQVMNVQIIQLPAAAKSVDEFRARLTAMDERESTDHDE
jgi:hypothetical protein